MNNPPAFPLDCRNHNGEGFYFYGLTMRDYFAAKAMQAAITGCATRGEVGVYSNWAGLAYGMADAMLAAREKP